MKKTQFKELGKNILRSKASFLSVLMFVLCGCMMFFGIDTTGQTIKQSLDNSFKNSNAYNLNLLTAYGMQQSDINELKLISDVDNAEGIFTGYEFFTYEKTKSLASIASLTKEIDLTRVVAGRLPENENEAVIEQGSTRSFKYNIGDTIEFYGGNGFNNYLISSVINWNSLSPQDIVIDDISNLKQNKVTITGIVANPHHYSSSKAGNGVTPDKGTQIDCVFYTNYSSFNENVTGGRYSSVSIKNNDLSNKSIYSEDYKKQEVEFANKFSALATPAIDKVNALFNTNFYQILQKAIELEAQAKIMYDNGEISLSEYLAIVAARSSIESYSSNLTDKAVFGVSKRGDNIAIPYMTMLSTNINNVKYSLGGIFILISFIICYSVITRLVKDDAKLIGTKKALGFKRLEITKSYLLYTLLAVLFGAVLGCTLSYAVALALVPAVLPSFDISSTICYFNPLLMLYIFLGILVVNLLITLLACNSVLKRNAILLLQGDVQNKTKLKHLSKTNLWKRFTIFTRSILYNFFSEKSRIFATLLGVISCVTMLTGSLMMYFDVEKSFQIQYQDYFKFDSFVSFDSNNESGKADIISYFEEKNIPYTPVYRDTFSFNFENSDSFGGYTYCFEDFESFNKMVKLESSSNKTYDGKGLWMPFSYKQFLNLSDEVYIKVINSTGTVSEYKTSGFYKYYSYLVMAFMDKDTFKQMFGYTRASNTFFIDTKSVDKDSLISDLSKIDGYIAYENYYEYTLLDLKAFTGLAFAVVALYLIVSVLMGVFVILNLLITNIKEKKNQLITLRINGYTHKQTCKYISMDMIAMTIIGLILGVGFGFLLGKVIVASFETIYLTVYKEVSFISAVIGILITLLIVIVMSFISFKKIKKLKLTDINSLN